MRGRKPDGRFAPHGGIGVRGSIDDKASESGHARSNNAVAIDREPRSDQTLDRRMCLEWRKPQLLCKLGIGWLLPLQSYKFQSSGQILGL